MVAQLDVDIQCRGELIPLWLQLSQGRQVGQTVVSCLSGGGCKQNWNGYLSERLPQGLLFVWDSRAMCLQDTSGLKC